jgi:alpha-glucosidase
MRSWWRGAVLYQVYIRSFADSNDDGVGDLPGITSRLPYLKSLGVDGLWITPFYPSPQKDHGYDVADYYGVNPEYGTLDDFDQLVGCAHELGLKLLVDLVPNHTSSSHPWFKAALSAPDDPHRHLYYFVPGKNGSPPNNWLSAFGGPAWTPEERWGRWYMHLFAPEQPDLNWWNPAVPEEFTRIVRYWLDRGADGYRIDVAPALFKRNDLADRPLVTDPRTGLQVTRPGFSITDQDPVHGVYREWRRIANSYEPERVLLGEVFDPSRQVRYIRPDQLHMAFALVDQPWEAGRWKKAIEVFRRAVSHSTSLPTWTLSNHDIVRHVTRLGGGPVGRERARAALLLLLGLPGQFVIYQGDELGLEEAYVPPADRQDPLFIYTNGANPGRDGCRVPLPWRQGAPNAGFSTAKPWLPMPGGWDRRAVDAQSRSSGSNLSLYRRVLALGRRLAHRLPSTMRWEVAPEGCLRYRRGLIVVACNFTRRRVELSAGGRLLVASGPGVKLGGGSLSLPADSAVWIETLRSPEI